MTETDCDPEKNKKGTIPTFTPVPRKCPRHDGWTPERQRGFIEGLADCGSVTAAARAVGMTPDSAYVLRRHPEAGEFRQAWDAALGCGVQRLEDVAMERAFHGIEVPVYHFGQVVGTRRVYNDALLMFLLRNRAPRRFSADSWQNTDAVTRGQLEKLKKQWIAEHEEERRRNAPSPKSVRASLDRKVAEMKALVLADFEKLPPHVKEAHANYERLRAEWEAQQREAASRPDARRALPAPAIRDMSA